jgi:hypothetical protein
MILKDFREPTFESERSSVFAENTLIPEEQATIKNKHNENSLKITSVQQNISSTTSLAALAFNAGQ